MDFAWHPISAISFDDPPCLATTAALRLMLRGGPVELRYAGDRMWPSVADGASFRLDPREEHSAVIGDAVVASIDGIPDLLRVVSRSGDRVVVTGDADESTGSAVLVDELLGIADLAPVTPSAPSRLRRRLALDLREAWRGRVDDAPEPGATVLEKYDDQAEGYVAATSVELDPDLLRCFERHARPSGRVLVVGSGTGRECFALERAGFELIGIDFSPRMVEAARAQARERSSTVRFEIRDIRRFDFRLPPVDAVLFTYDVYSFVPDALDRVSILRRIRSGCLRPDGSLFLSARVARTLWARLVLSLQWLAAQREGRRSEWGESHTRWIGSDGATHRSYVRSFSETQLAAEISRGGFRTVERQGGHRILKLE